jgi:hypothetical protein
MSFSTHELNLNFDVQKHPLLVFTGNFNWSILKHLISAKSYLYGGCKENHKKLWLFPHLPIFHPKNPNQIAQ